MRKLLIIGLVAGFALVQAPAFGAEEEGAVGKDNCLLASINCGNSVRSIHETIDSLRGEISKGTDVYTKDELRRLEMKLRDTERTLRSLEYENGMSIMSM